jgi:site-specific DNA-methyltransferase (adenine-specific)
MYTKSLQNTKVMITMSSNFIKMKKIIDVPETTIYQGDCLEVLDSFPDNTFHAVVTDPPYGIKEYEEKELIKKANGNGGIWRIPPSFDGHTRSPLPRFTALTQKERENLVNFVKLFGTILINKMVPGAHLFIASNSFLSQLVFSALTSVGLEFRTEIIRIVQTLRGGDRPKNEENIFPDVCSLPRGCYEPWGLFRKPIPSKMTVGECLRKYKTGGIRRKKDGTPFSDVIRSKRTPALEKEIAKHPSLKPQSFLRQLVYSALPLGQGLIVDPFMGSGSTLAAAIHEGYHSIGIEKNEEYYNLAVDSILKLSKVETITDFIQPKLFLYEGEM